MLACRARALLDGRLRAVGRRRRGAGAAGAAPSHGADLRRARRWRRRMAQVIDRLVAAAALMAGSRRSFSQRAEAGGGGAAAAAGRGRARRRDGGARRARPPPRRHRARPSGSSANTSPAMPATRIDWRESAKSQRLYVRETEWEAAQSVWLWRDGSPSMDYASTPRPADQARARRSADAGAGGAAAARRRARDAARLGPARRATAAPCSTAWRCCIARGDAGGEPARRSSRCRATRQIVLIGDLLSPLDEIDALVARFAATRRQGPSAAGARSRRGDAAVRRPRALRGLGARGRRC